MVVYPNPTKEYINLLLPDASKGEDFLNLYNFSGQSVELNFIPSNQLEKLIMVKLPELNPGLYLLRYHSGDRIYLAKVFVQD